MPHLTLRTTNGFAIVDLSVGVTRARAKALRAAGRRLPTPVTIRGLIDTGASGTAIDPGVIRLLELQPTGVSSIHTPSTAGQAHRCHAYDVSLHVDHPAATGTFDPIVAVESDLAAHGFQALIGCNVLKKCLFIYDGQAATFSLAF